MQNNINSEEIRGLDIPLPPFPVQRDLVAQVNAARAEIARERASPRPEAMILGRERPMKRSRASMPRENIRHYF